MEPLDPFGKQKIQRSVELHHEYAIRKTETVGNSTGQQPRFFYR